MCGSFPERVERGALPYHRCVYTAVYYIQVSIQCQILVQTGTNWYKLVHQPCDMNEDMEKKFLAFLYHYQAETRYSLLG